MYGRIIGESFIPTKVKQEKEFTRELPINHEVVIRYVQPLTKVWLPPAEQ